MKWFGIEVIVWIVAFGVLFVGMWVAMAILERWRVRIIEKAAHKWWEEEQRWESALQPRA